MKSSSQIGVAAIALLALSGCAATSPDWEATFGDAARQLRAQQLIDRDAPTRNQGALPTADGRSTLEATERYVDSFKAPPPTTVVVPSGGR